MDEDEHAMEVIVPDDQLSLAIGKKGQNVRLASRLTGWKLDVRSEAEVEIEHARSLEQLTAFAGISNMTAELLYQNGFKSVADIAEAVIDALLDVEGLGEEKAAAVLQAAREHMEAAARQKLENVNGEGDVAGDGEVSSEEAETEAALEVIGERA